MKSDNEIIMAMEKFKCVNCNGDCAKESYEDLDCPINLVKFSLDLINRLQTENKKNENIIRLADKTIETANAEIERLNIRNKTLTAITKNYDWKFEKAKSEAIKEFAERIKEIAIEKGNVPIVFDDIDNLVKEMVGDAR